MAKIRKFWVSREELEETLAGQRIPPTTIDAANVGGLTAGSIPFADASGFLAEDNAALFWDAAEDNLGIGVNTFSATMTQGIQMGTGLAPTANVADSFAFYSADFVAGNACPHFRSENGTVIGLNQSLLTTDSPTFASGVIIGNLTLADGSITDSGGAISFGNENLSTTGTLGCGEITVADGSSINLQEAITFTGATTENLIEFPDNLANALSFMEAGNPYQTFITTDGSEAIQLHKPLGIGIAPEAQNILHMAVALDWAISSIDSYNATDNYSAVWKFRRSHSDTKGTKTRTLTGDMLGDFWFQGVDTAGNFDRGAGIKATQVGATDTRVPTNLALETYHNTGKNTGQLILVNDGTITSTGCITDGTCEIMKSRDAIGIINETLKTGTGKIDKHGHEKWDMKKLYKKYPFLIYEYKGFDDDGNEIITYHDRIGAKGDLAYAAILQLEERIKALEAQLNN